MVFAGKENIGSLAENLVYISLDDPDARYYLGKEGGVHFISGKSAMEVKYVDNVFLDDVGLLTGLMLKGISEKKAIIRRGMEVKGLKTEPLLKFASDTL